MCCLLAGCSDGRPKRVPVAGQVFIDGKPLTVGSVRFTPPSGRPASGMIDKDGRFSLSTFEPGDGCPLGEHRVSIVGFENVSSTTRRWLVPKTYSSPDSSGLTQTVEGPSDSVKFELTWGNVKGPIIEKVYGE
jgi:hypothetical protein